MRIVTLNLKHGGGTRIPSICEYVQSLDADAFVATEHRQATALSNKLFELGFQTQVAGPGEKNSVLVAANINGEPVIHDARRLMGLRFGRFSVLGTYFPQKHEKKALFKYLLENPPSDDWHISSYRAPSIKAGTTVVEISKMRQPFSDDDVTKLSEHLGQTYDWLIRQGCSMGTKAPP